jgi:hypothetical protein
MELRKQLPKEWSRGGGSTATSVNVTSAASRANARRAHPPLALPPHARLAPPLLAAALVLLACALVGCAGNGSGSGGKTTTPPPPTTSPSVPVSIFPGSASVPINGTAQFTAFLPSAPSATFTWSISGGSSNGSIDASTGVYTAPASVPSPATVTVTATASSSKTSTGTASINITAAQGLAVSPAAVTVAAGATQTFSATMNGSAVSPTWQVNGTAGGDSVHGTINASGLYTAPLTPPPGGVTTITAITAGDSGTATVAVLFSNDSLAGPYAFAYSGADSAGPLVAAGSFSAVPSAGTLSGVEDYNSKDLKSAAQEISITGTYTVYPDGSGTASITNSAISGTETWRFTLISGTQGTSSQRGLLARFDTSATGSGTLDQQNPINFSAASITGNYAFGVSGADSDHHPLHITGKFRADGAGTIPINSAEQDYNDNGINTLSAPDTTLNGTYTMDASFPNSGRGVLTLINTSAQIPGTFNFAFYIVDSTHLKLVEIDTMAILSGDCYSAPNSNGSFVQSIFSGNYSFELAGSDISNSIPYGIVGALGSNGTGSITGGVWDVNDGGLHIQTDVGLATSAYTVDASFGRVAFTLAPSTANASTPVENFAVYTTSSGKAEIIELDTGITANGLAYSQSNEAFPQGSFALNLAGNDNKSGFPEQDIVGEITVNSTNSVVDGNLNINDDFKLSPGVPLVTGSTVVAPAQDGRGTATIDTNSSGDNYPIAYYTVDGTTILVIETDGVHVLTGTLLKQF